MKVGAHSLKVTRTAHYYTLGKPGPDVRYFWIACHGYGQLARHFITKFDVLPADRHFVLAPEGLSRFYWQGLSGKVAASWMTSADRLDEIEDYANYLQILYEQFRPQLPSGVKVILFGFSQGCATQMRWVMRHFPAFDHLIFWAGTIPEDIDYLPHQKYFSDKSLHVIYGTDDPFLTAERIAWHRQLLTDQQLTVEESTFAGKHTVDREALRQWVGHFLPAG